MKLSNLFPDPGIRSLVVNYERDATRRIESLTRTQRVVMEQMIAGHLNKEIAFRLNLSPRTIENHRAAIFERTGAKSLVDLLRFAILADIEDRFSPDEFTDEEKPTPPGKHERQHQ